MKISEEKFFVLTNPLFWLWGVVIFGIYFIRKFLDVTGLYDWFYVLVTFDKMSENGKKQMIFIMNTPPKLFWLKRKAWEYAVAKIKKQRTD